VTRAWPSWIRTNSARLRMRCARGRACEARETGGTGPNYFW
jgi:hypothetical protein